MRGVGALDGYSVTEGVKRREEESPSGGYAGLEGRGCPQPEIISP